MTDRTGATDTSATHAQAWPVRVQSFRDDLRAILGRSPDASDRFALALSGGGDSTALFLLAQAALGNGAIHGLTVDHGLRPESADEAMHVAALCRARGVGHDILHCQPDDKPSANIQATARAARYRLMADWCGRHSYGWLLTGHHLDDQAETFWLRAARGSGLAGLSGVRVRRDLAPGLVLARPLLSWRRRDLAQLVAQADIAVIDDPSNRLTRFDRVRARAFLQDHDWPAAPRLAATAHHLAQAEEALSWAVDRLWDERAQQMGAAWQLDLADLPGEMMRRLVLRAITALAPSARISGPDLARLMASVQGGQAATLAGVYVKHAPVKHVHVKHVRGKNHAGHWRLSLAPPRRGQGQQNKTS